MMEHSPRRFQGGSGAFLFWKAMLAPCLMTLALHHIFVDGYPFLQNSSSSLLDSIVSGKSSEIVYPTPEDDLALSSEEEDNDYTASSLDDNYPINYFDKNARNRDREHSAILAKFTQMKDSLLSNNISESASFSETKSHDGNASSIKGLANDRSKLGNTRHGKKFNAPSATSSMLKGDESLENSSAEPVAREVLVDNNNNNEDVNLIGFSVDYDSDKRRVEYDSEGSPLILEGLEVKLMLYGKFKEGTMFRFSKSHYCVDPHINKDNEDYEIDIKNEENTVATVNVRIPEGGELNLVYLCLRSPTSSRYKRQGESADGESGLPIKPWLVIKLTKSMFPMSLHVLFIVLLLMLSGLFSGLNLGLMSLDKTDLKIIVNTGSKSEKKYASSIAPVRNHGNFLLCCLLFSNVLVNATLTILVDDLTTGLIAIAGSTLAIVIFGEIIPQAICSRYGLAVGAKTIYITKIFMVLTAPLAFPLSKLLDKILGEEIGNIYTRERLKELLKVTQDHHGLETEEVGIISGALDLKTKTVKDVMVPLTQIFMLPADTVLDFDTMAEIEYQGYSRIPVFDGERSNVVALINVRQLTLLDASDNIPLRTIMDFYKQNLFFVFENTHLDFMFKAFREGSRGHMAFVQLVNDRGPGDPYYETVGMLTMEDVLEEILQADIKDENDVEKLDQRTGKAQQRPPPVVPFRNNKKPKKVVGIPATLAHAATQFLSTSVDPFKFDTVSVHIIQRVLKTNVQFMKAPKRKGRAKVQEVFLYENGKAADSFIMILEGRVHVTVGKERLMYEAGPFSTFGTDFLLNDYLGAPLRTITTGDSALNSPTELDPSERPSITSEMADIKRKATFIPDYSVKLLTDIYFLRLRHEHYRHALAATELEKVYQADPEKAPDGLEWQEEIDKVLDRGDADDDDGDEHNEPEPTAEHLNVNIKVNGLSMNGTLVENNTSTTTETDSDNKDSDHDENHPNEATKLLPNNIPYI